MKQGYLIEIPGAEIAELVTAAQDELLVAKDDKKQADTVVKIRERRLHFLEGMLAMDQARQQSLDDPDVNYYVLDEGDGPRAVDEIYANSQDPGRRAYSICYARFRNGEQYA